MNQSSTAMRGGAIVLVIIIMICLSVFGVLAMVSAHADFLLASKSASWVSRYYQLDAAGQEMVSGAADIAREQGFAALEDSYWHVDGDRASIIVTLTGDTVSIAGNEMRQSEQILHIAIERDGDGVRIVQWLQEQRQPDYQDIEQNIWSGD